MTPASWNSEVRIDVHLLGNDLLNIFSRQRIRSNNRVTSVAMQRRGKHASSTIEVVFSAWSVPRSYLEDNWRYSVIEGSAVEC
jgi:hypothetical protein